VQKLALFINQIFLFSTVLIAQTELIFEDYNDQDMFNNFSGNWGVLCESKSSFDITNCYGTSGACLKIKYSFDTSSIGGIWHSLIGINDYKNHYLDFADLYGDLKNSSDNPTNVENIKFTKFNFWAKGNKKGDYIHVVKVEFKDIDGNIKILKRFSIHDSSGWTKYEYPIDTDENDLRRLKEVTFVLEKDFNDSRTDSLYFDDLSFTTTEAPYDASSWSKDQFLDLVAHRAFYYFLTFTDTKGFALDKSTLSNVVSIAAIGFQLTAYCIGYKRGWADDLETKVETILQNLIDLPKGKDPGTNYSGYKGFFYHLLKANNGLRLNNDVELSLYDTMLLIYGVLICKEYFSDHPTIPILAQALYDSVQWKWMVDTTSGENQNQFFLEWKPETSFNYHASCYTDEAFLVDVLAIGSTTYGTKMETYNARKREIGYNIYVGPPAIVVALDGSLFNYFFASCWLDLQNRGIDRHAIYPINIWENNRRAIIANHQFCIDHQDDVIWDNDDDHTTYVDSSWGLTACESVPDKPGGWKQYYAFGALPTQRNIQNSEVHAPHLGTIAVYGAGSSITYIPDTAIAALRYYYSNTDLWSPLFGFGDGYNADPHYFETDINGQAILDEKSNLIIHPATWMNGAWYNHAMLGIDEGPMLLAIENYRSGMIWNLANKNDNITAGLDSIFGQQSSKINDEDFGRDPKVFILHQNYPNPFNASTTIRYDLPKESHVTLKVYNMIGQEIKELVNKYQPAGSKSVIWDGENNADQNISSGIYICRLEAFEFLKKLNLILVKKLILLK